MKAIKFSSILIITIISVFGLTVSLQTLLAAWVPPTASPPGANISPPIFASSSVDQTISGGGDLTVSGGNLVTTDSLIALGGAAIGGWISADGDFEGIRINSNGNVLIGSAAYGTDVLAALGIGGSLAVGEFYNQNPPIGGAIFEGWVGIGRSTPLARLHVGNFIGESYTAIDIDGTGWGGGHRWRLASTATGAGQGVGKLVFRDESIPADRVTFDADGNVGIGTVNPGYRLDVVGDVRWTGTLQGGSVPWARLSSFPAACSAGQYVTAVGGSLTCSTPAGGLPPGTSGQTLRHDGAGWVANSVLFNNGTNVGIGTAGPTAKLEVNLVNPSGWSGNLKALRMLSPDNSYYLDVNTYVVGAGNVGYHFSPNTNTGLVITTPGNVGIGTVNPGSKLDVRGEVTSVLESHGQFRAIAGGYGFFLRNDGTNTYFLLTNFGDVFGLWNNLRPFYINNATGDVRLGTVTGGGIYVRHSDGNVGIGLTNPAQKLDVAGQIHATGDICTDAGGGKCLSNMLQSFTCPCGTCWETRTVYSDCANIHVEMCTPAGWKSTSLPYNGCPGSP